MRCRYCFYADECAVRSIKSYGIMSADTAHKVIDRAYELTSSGNVLFAFQGGEPLVAGYDYFTDFVAYAKKNKPVQVNLSFSLQTNGTPIDEKWCALFKENNFLIGLSLDGPENINDVCRVDAEKKGTYRRVVSAARMMKKAGVDFNILSVVTKYSAAHPLQVWKFYKQNDFGFVQFIPCLAPLEEYETFDYTLTPSDYSNFLKVLFNAWADDFEKGKYTSVRLFDNLVRMAMGERPEMCGMLGSCGVQFVIEADGGVYPCDFYVLDDYLAGNVHDSSFKDIFASETMQRFLKESDKPAACPDCRFFPICRGGCKRYRSFYSLDPEKCPYADFLESSYKRINAIANMIKNKKY